ncbi:MAG: nodulation protein NfeD [candidate division Zixibacteria bacterium]|nr:nodulation protein NfeD [candidate division Zixibacteria bacterium]
MANSRTRLCIGRSRLLLAIAAGLLVLLFAAPVQAQDAFVITIDGAIGPVTDMVLENAIEQAEDEGGAVLIIRLDTPGGLVSTTKEINQSILNSNVPVVVYVAPSGASATSAGVFILASAHFAVMAPGTNAGAAHPVVMQGEMDSTMSAKAENDAAAHIRSLAERRERNADWYERAVRESESLTATQALDSNVIDFIAEDVEGLLDSLDGRVAQLPRGEDTLKTAAAPVNEIELTWREKLLNVITDPNIAYILMSIGWLGILMELYNPGAIFPGVIGTICLILGFYALQTLPIDYAGLALIGLAIIMFILELKIVSHGVLGLGGTISLLIGSLMLIDSPDPAMDISLSVILAVVGTTVAFFVLAFYLVVKVRSSRPTTGEEGMIGMIGTARQSFEKSGMIYVAGEYWTAETSIPVSEGTQVEVTGKTGTRLTVKPIS